MKADEVALFTIANKFGIRHNNDQQHTDFNKPTWVTWMFYIYLATVHALVRASSEGG